MNCQDLRELLDQLNAVYSEVILLEAENKTNTFLYHKKVLLLNHLAGKLPEDISAQ